MKGIVGFEISIEKIEGKWKLSQNRDDENYKNVIRELELLQTEEGHAVATEMRKLRHLE
jgi:transcriptional regulator